MLRYSVLCPYLDVPFSMQEWLRLHGRIYSSLRCITEMDTNMSLYMRIQESFWSVLEKSLLCFCSPSILFWLDDMWG